MPGAAGDGQRFSEILALGEEIGRVKDVDVLLEKILTLARRFASADAGSIYVKEGDKLLFSHTQNDTLQSKLPAGKKLIYSTFTVPINHNSIAGCVASTGKALNLADVYCLPGGCAYGFDGSFDEAVGYRTKSMLAVPLLTTSGVIGVLQLINARDQLGNIHPFGEHEVPLIMHLAGSAALALERARMTRTLILRMIKMAELRDPKETGGHVNRVAAYAVEIYEEWARRKGMTPEDIHRDLDVLRMAAMLHDVGKVAIADAILKKPGRLNEEEVRIMRQHTWLGSQLFSDQHSDFDVASNIVVMNHHERWDGLGYPGYIDPSSGRPLPGYERGDGSAVGKKGEEIHPFGRVVAIADVYDALSCRRSYKEAWDEARVLETISEESGKQFDPEMVDALFHSIDMVKNLAERFPD